MVKLSIIIPVYNQEDLISTCLESIPVRDDIETLVINDGSTDNTLGVISKYDHINIITIDNSGPGVARNVGIDNAKGEYILFIDSDDYIYTDVLNYILDNNILDNYDIIKTLQERNDYKTGISNYTLRGSFVKRDFIGDIRQPETYISEDEKFLRLLEDNKPRIKNYSDRIFYHYNFPRVGSLIGRSRNE